jgi:hypothetical protein
MEAVMSRCTLRRIFTVLIYAGVGLFLYPYLTGRLSSGLIYLVAGIAIAVLAGILRCVCIEGDCAEREAKASIESAMPPTEPHGASRP